jgi:hypothetical protein
VPDYSDIVEKHFKRVGLDPAWGKKIMQIESGGHAESVTGSYKGLFQLSNQEFREGGGTGNIHDPEQNTMAAANVLSRKALQFQQKYGKNPNLVDVYMMHQQGEAGYNAHMSNPNAPAWENMQSASGKSEAWAKKAIWGNMTDSAKARYGSVENVSSKDFVGEWSNKLTGATYTATGVKTKGQRPGVEPDEPEEKQSLANQEPISVGLKVPTSDFEVPQLTPQLRLAQRPQ